ncbi:MAG: hypothetical protein K2J20_01850 [Bacilli bacterium]|nr:hypothetical protein [Bacilli bacterium]
MNRYIEIFLSGKKYRFLIDDELDKVLRASLRDKYQFDTNNNLVIEADDLVKYYRLKQLVLKSVLKQANTYDLPPELQSRINTLNNYVSPKSTIYNSDLTMLDSVLSEASEIYGSVRTNLTKKEVVQSKAEFAETPIKEPIVEQAEIPDDTSTNTTESPDDKITEFKTVLEEIAEDDTLKDEVPAKDINDALDRIVICDSTDEFIAKTASNPNSYNITGAIQNKSEEIVLPPNANLDNVLTEIVRVSCKDEETVTKIVNYAENQATYKKRTTVAFDNMRSRLKVSGLNAGNLNYFGDIFCDQFEQICKDTGTSFERMFADYFNGYSANRKHNSPLEKFILQFLTFNGGDDKTRHLLETTIVKKAIARNLISSRYNSYLSADYRDLSYNGNGYINFDNAMDTTAVENISETSELETSISGNVDVQLSGSASSTMNTNIEHNATLNYETQNNLNHNVNYNMSSTLNSGLNGRNRIAQANNWSAGRRANKIDGVAQGTSYQADLEKKEKDQVHATPELDKEDDANIAAVPPINGPGTNAFDGSAAKKLDPLIEPEKKQMPATELGAEAEQAPNDKVIPFPYGSEINPYVQRRNTPAKGKNNIINLKDFLSKKNNRFNNGIRENINAFGEDEAFGNETNSNSLPSDNELEDSENDSVSDNEKNNNQNNSNNTSSPNSAPVPAVADDENPATETLKEKAKKSLTDAAIAIAKKHPVVIITVGVFLIIIIMILIVSMSGDEPMKFNAIGVGGYPYLELTNACEEVYVYDTPSGVDGTYPLEEYIAGVVQHEVGAFNNDTMYEVLAITARTYALRRMQNSNSCSIPGNSTAQVFGKTDNERVIAAANNTRGLVLAHNGSLISTEYDAFCWDTKDDKYFYVCQKNYDTGEPLKVPVEWADEYVRRITGAAFLNTPHYQSHGRGMSQDGAFYMATELDYDCAAILAFFYGSDAKIMSIYPSVFTGEFPLNPSDNLYQGLTFLTNTSMGQLLASNGTTIDEFNAYLKQVVETSGVGTREAVVNVATSLIGSLAQMGYKLNYDWGGKYYAAGVNYNWGEVYNNAVICNSYGYNKNECLNSYKWRAFDCSGFVNWSLLNGFGLSSLRELQARGIFQLTQTASAKKVILNSNTAVCSAGDVLIKPKSHIVLIVGIDESAKKYIVAESTGSNLSAGTGGLKLSYYSYNASGYFCGDMSSVYQSSREGK